MLVRLHVTGFKVKIIKHKGTLMARMWASPPVDWTPERQEVDFPSGLASPPPFSGRLLPPSAAPSDLSVGLKELPLYDAHTAKELCEF